MNAHALAKQLLAGPDIPVTFADDCGAFEVAEVIEAKESFHGEGDTSDTPRDSLGYIIERPCIALIGCSEAPPSREQIAEQKAAKAQMEEDRKRLTPEAFSLKYAFIESISPDDLVRMASAESDLAAKLKK